MKLTSIMVFTGLICALVSGCGDNATHSNSAGTTPPTQKPADQNSTAHKSTAQNSTVQLANPAASYCAALGGRSEIRRSAAGEQGICTLPNGEQIDEWELFRLDHPQSKSE
ncbi:MAG: putative hemolysin [Shewanella sp.]